MPKTLDLTTTTSTNLFYATSGTLNFLQTAVTEGQAAAIIAQIGDTYDNSIGYILYGCNASTGGGNTTIGAGVLFFAGSVYLTLGDTFTTPTGGNVVVANFRTLNNFREPDGGNCDPATFTTGARNAHNDIIATFASGASGSGDIANYSNLVPVQTADKVVLSSLSALQTVTFPKNVNVLCPGVMPVNVTFNLDGAAGIAGRKVRYSYTGHSGGTTVIVAATGTVSGDINYGVSAGVTGVIELTFLGNDGVNNIFTAKAY